MNVTSVVACLLTLGLAAPAHGQGCARDFDFEFGAWAVTLQRLVDPLSGADEWVEYTGTSVVRRVWNGRANLGELEVDGPAGRIQGISLRLLDPRTCQWKVHWASSRDGAIGPAMVGGFSGGIGEFYNQETFNGRSIFVRFIFSDITSHTFRLEQAFSADGGKSWEPNWIAAFEKVRDGEPPSGSDAPSPEPRPAELTTTVEEFHRAQTRNDVATLTRLVADDYVLVNSDATVEDKQQFLAAFDVPGFKLEPYDVKQPMEKAWDNAAVLGGLVRLSWTLGGEDHTRLVHIVHVWSRRDGRWRLTYTQVTRVPSEEVGSP